MHPALNNDAVQQPRGAAFHQVLIIIFTALFLSGGSKDGVSHLSATLSEVVVNAERRAQAEEIAARILATESRAVSQVLDSRLELYEVLGRYDAEPWEVLRAFEDGISRVEAEESTLLDLRYELRDTLTAPEWTAMHQRLSEFE